jgi:hypothetical protein
MAQRLASNVVKLITDWKHPDYVGIFRARMWNLEQIRAHPDCLPDLKAYYKETPADFINDWGITFDPRNAEIGLPTTLPFILFDKQREFIDFVLRKWRERKSGLVEKSRDMGVTWEAISLSCTLCLFHDGVAIGFGSRKEEYVDKVGTLKPILPKGRMFMEHLPVEFRGSWVAWRDAPHMRISFPETGSLISGEAGDEIGRGDRTSITFVDEAAHLAHPDLVDAALSQTTNCRIDMSSVRGMANSFAAKRWGGKIEVFIFDWRDDPRKDDAWYAKQVEELDPVVVAQEIDRDYLAAVKGVVIPGEWVRAAIDARTKLGIAPSGLRALTLDVADEGIDKNATCETWGTEVERTKEFTGKGSDLYATTEWCFQICDEEGYGGFRYDADGLGAGVRGDARALNEKRQATGARALTVVGFRGSEGVHEPEGVVEGTIGTEGDKGRTNQDYFANRKAQGWWSLRKRFQRTFRWVVGGIPCAPDDIISLSSKNPDLMKLVAQLSQPVYRTNEVGKMVVDKAPRNLKTPMKSPNEGDAVMMRYAPMETAPVPITGDMLAQIARAGRIMRR